MTLAKFTNEQRANKQGKNVSESPVEDTTWVSVKKMLKGLKQRALNVLKSQKKEQTQSDTK